MPYDRANTSMSEFPMCPDCAAEYADPADRRFHAETVCCNNCGPRLEDFEARAADLERGEIVMVKGIGGYHLACSVYGNVGRLREIKGRDAKPFAVMFKNVAQVKLFCELSDEAESLLLSTARPIVLLEALNNNFKPEVLMGDNRCGAFLPYTALHELLLERVSPLVLTSANVSSAPILTDDRAATEFARRHGIKALTHDRKILRPVEDSVAVVSAAAPYQVIRRGRGYAPLPIKLRKSVPPTLAMGGDLKASFALAKGTDTYLSQCFGDLENADVFENYTREIDEFQRLLAIKPEVVICDSHPGYISSSHAHSMNLSTVRVQHHHAHIASVMAEHDLKAAFGVAFDGTGYGDDGAVWGGEFLLCEGAKFERAAHLPYAALVGGDEAARDARKTAACYLKSDPILNAAVGAGLGVQTSSMGRLFDAVSAILGVCGFNGYEGQCAIALQNSAERALKRGETPVFMEFSEKLEFGNILEQARECLPERVDSFALGFHIAVAGMVVRTAKLFGGGLPVALSGGTFQNALLLRLCAEGLTREGFAVYINRDAPPNDGGLALGQAHIFSLMG
ncbi:carbamoyltransferase [Clostridia bacterium]|nr:carbamoyltransferase [Clostridia bacterium]